MKAETSIAITGYGNEDVMRIQWGIMKYMGYNGICNIIVLNLDINNYGDNHWDITMNKPY